MDSLLTSLSIDEKITLTQRHQPAIPRLGLPAFSLEPTGSTSDAFPRALGMGTTWNPDLVRRIGATVAEDSIGAVRKVPVVNPLHDPRLGRNGEAFAEDPLLGSMLGAIYSLGMRGPCGRHLRTAPLIRHVDESDRCAVMPGFNLRAFNEYELPVFRAAFETGAAVGLVLSQELFDDFPAVASQLVHQIVREWGGNDAVVLSETTRQPGDWAKALKLGADGFVGPAATTAQLTEAYRLGRLTEDEITAAVRRLLVLRDRLGQLGAKDAKPCVSSPIGRNERRSLALQAAREAVVLLRNDGLLPLLVGQGIRVALIGDASVELEQALARRVDVIRSTEDDTVASTTDVAVVVVGGLVDSDRKTLALPADQQRLVRAVRAANPNTVLLVMSDCPYALSWEDSYVPAIVWTAHSGEASDLALAEMLFGDYSPAGRVPQTWYSTDEDLPDSLDYDLLTANRTYLHYEGKPLYAFGHGLSYTTFSYGRTQLSSRLVTADGEVSVVAEVRNTGFRDSDEVVQFYTRQLTSRVKQPRRQLRGFRRIRVAANTSTRITFRLRATDLSFWDVTTDRWVVETALHELIIGGSSDCADTGAILDVKGESVGARTLVDRTIAAKSYDKSAGVSLVDINREVGGVIAASRAGGWVGYLGYDVTGCRSWSLTAAAKGDRPIPVELRADSPTGTLLGTVQVASADKYQVVSGALPKMNGMRDLFLVFVEQGSRVLKVAFHV